MHLLAIVSLLVFVFTLGWLGRCRRWLGTWRLTSLAELLRMMEVHGLWCMQVATHLRTHLRTAKAYGLLVGNAQLRPTRLAVGIQMWVLVEMMPLPALASFALTCFRL